MCIRDRTQTASAAMQENMRYQRGISFLPRIPTKQNQLTRQWIDGKRLSAASMEYKKRSSSFHSPVPVISGLTIVVG